MNKRVQVLLATVVSLCAEGAIAYGAWVVLGPTLTLALYGVKIACVMASQK